MQRPADLMPLLALLAISVVVLAARPAACQAVDTLAVAQRARLLADDLLEGPGSGLARRENRGALPHDPDSFSHV